MRGECGWSHEVRTAVAPPLADVIESWLIIPASFQREALPFACCTLASAAFGKYKTRGGSRASPLPDFYIGAHAQVEGHTLLTRDANRYHTCFPAVPLISP